MAASAAPLAVDIWNTSRFPEHKDDYRTHALSVHQSIRPVAGQDDHIDGRGVVGHTDPVRLGPVLSAVEVDDGGEGAGHDAEYGERGAIVEPSDGRFLENWTGGADCRAIWQAIF